MAGINSLIEIYKKKGKEFIDELFNKYVTVNEKMDGSVFLFERGAGGNFNFYKRDYRFPITKVDRVLMKYWEKPISYIQSLPSEVQNQIPIHWRFGFDYFIDNQPLDVKYETAPKNNLILSYVQVRNSKGQLIRTIDKKVELDKWADLLGVEKTPIIFQGFLDNDQKRSIVDFLNTYPEKLKKEYGTTSFIKFLINILNPELKKSKLNSSLDYPIEGIVFKFGSADGREENVLAKVVDPMFEQITLEKEAKRGESRSNFGNTSFEYALNDMARFIIDEGISSFDSHGDSREEKYINYISDVFVKFLGDKERKRIYYGSDLDAPDFLKKESFKINLNLIKNEEAKKLIESDEGYESLFKMTLNSFRKHRKKEGGLIGKGELDQINMVVSDIDKFISSKEDGIIKESFLPSFSDFAKRRRDYMVVDDAEEVGTDSSPSVDDIKWAQGKEEEKIDSPDDLQDFPAGSTGSNMSEAPDKPSNSYSEIEIKDEDELPDPYQGLELTSDKFKETFDKITDEPNVDFGTEVPQVKSRINIIIGKFQPIHKGHMDMIHKLKKSNGQPVFLAVTYDPYSKQHLNMETMSKMLNMMKTESKDIEGYKKYKIPMLESIMRDLSQKYDIELIGCADGEGDDLKIQLDYIKKMNPEIKTEILEIPRISSGSEVRDSIKSNDYSKFKDNVPKSISLFYEDFRNSLNK
jgi:cytidyltransferase-like protein